MSHDSGNGKTTAGLVVQIVATILATVTVIFAISTPLILMYARLGQMDVEINSKLQEIETQFHSVEETRNIQFSEQQRINSLLWNASSLGKDSPYPSAPFYQPNVSKR
jgi:hypothetical protein